MFRNLVDVISEEVKGFGLCAQNAAHVGSGVIVLAKDGEFAATISPPRGFNKMDDVSIVLSENYRHIHSCLYGAVREFRKCAGLGY